MLLKILSNLTHCFPDGDSAIVINGFFRTSSGKKSLDFNHYHTVISYSPYLQSLDSLNHGISELVNEILFDTLPSHPRR